MMRRTNDCRRVGMRWLINFASDLSVINYVERCRRLIRGEEQRFKIVMRMENFAGDPITRNRVTGDFDWNGKLHSEREENTCLSTCSNSVCMCTVVLHEDPS